MITVIVVIHLLIAMAMIALILLQKTEGAAGGGLAASANLSSMMQPRARANPLSRATVFLGIAFFGTSIGLALLSKEAGPAPSIFVAPDAANAPRVDELRTDPTAQPSGTPAPNLDATPAPNLNGPAVPAVPQGGAAPAVPSN
jgi:preprotein translocase subunit SecG